MMTVPNFAPRGVGFRFTEAQLFITTTAATPTEILTATMRQIRCPPFRKRFNEYIESDTAMYYLHLAAEHGNQYAAQLIHSIRVNGNWMAALASLRLLGHMARVIQNRLEDERRGRENSIDRKLRRKIEEKKQAHGLKQ